MSPQQPRGCCSRSLVPGMAMLGGENLLTGGLEGGRGRS